LTVTERRLTVMAPLLLALLTSHVATFQFDEAASARAAAGKSQLEALAADTTCSARAVDRLRGGCREMDDQSQSRLAVDFTNCHLAKSGLTTYECTSEMSLADCTKPMVDSAAALAFNAYTHFYTHAESMCFYLQSREFQRSTETLVDQLHASAQGTASQLDSLKKDTESLGSKQRSLLGGVDRLLDLQAALFGEFADIKSVLFFTCAVLLALALTSTSRTAAARLPIFAMLTGSCLLEKTLAAVFLGRGASGPASAADVEALVAWLWLLRKATCAGGLCALCHAALCYTDLGRKTLSKLDELHALTRRDSEDLSAKIDGLARAVSPAPSASSSAASPSQPPASPPPLPEAGSDAEADLLQRLLHAYLLRLKRSRVAGALRAVGGGGNARKSPARRSPARRSPLAGGPGGGRRRSMSPLARGAAASASPRLACEAQLDGRSWPSAATPPLSVRLAQRAERRRSVE